MNTTVPEARQNVAHRSVEGNLRQQSQVAGKRQKVQQRLQQGGLGSRLEGAAPPGSWMRG